MNPDFEPRSIAAGKRTSSQVQLAPRAELNLRALRPRLGADVRQIGFKVHPFGQLGLDRGSILESGPDLR